MAELEGHSSGESEPPLYLTAHRWKLFLSDRCSAYQKLQQEREAGWHSSSLDQWYANRWASSGTPSASKGITACSTSTERGREADGSSSTTHFVAADIPQLTTRYCQHARRSWASGPSSSTFSRSRSFQWMAHRKRRREGDRNAVAETDAILRQFMFLDLGAAPGGVSTFLTTHLGWKGVGVTLPTDAGGIAMNPALEAHHQRSLQYLSHPGGPGRDGAFLIYDGDVTQKASEWRLRSVAAGDAPVPACLQRFPFEHHRFFFVNGGAVQDYGQRQPGDAAATKTNSTDRNAAILPWFTLFIPQLRLALEYVEDGGSIMLVFGAPHCASFFILLHLLSILLGPRARLRVCETMHLGKSPVYLLCEHVQVETEEEWRRRKTALFDALDHRSPVVCPYFAQDKVEGSEALDSGLLRREKEKFWLGESDTGFLLAASGLDAFGVQMERIWVKMTAFLQRRRVRAEEEIHVVKAHKNEEK